MQIVVENSFLVPLKNVIANKELTSNIYCYISIKKTDWPSEDRKY